MSPDAWYLFDPKDPGRAGQAMQRLRVEDTTLVLEQGTFAGWERVEVIRMDTPSALQRAIEARLAAARERGLAIENDALALVDRLSARHPEIEAAIQAVDELDSAAGREALAVCADFLQAEGDARGTLAALQLRDPDSWSARKWLADHRAHIFGPLALLQPRAQSPKLEWTGGWITKISRVEPSATDALPLAILLRLPACACLRSLEGSWAALREVLPDRGVWLRSLHLSDVDDEVVELGELLRLEDLVLLGCPEWLDVASARPPGMFVHPRTLADLHEFLTMLPIGPLERFGFHVPDTPPEHLQRVLEHPALHSLRELALDRVVADDERLRYPFLSDPMLNVILEAPLLHRLEVRDFSGLMLWWSQHQQLADAFAFAPGQTLLPADSGVRPR